MTTPPRNKLIEVSIRWRRRREDWPPPPQGTRNSFGAGYWYSY